MNTNQDTGSLGRPKRQAAARDLASLPSIEDGGVSDNTVASPALGFGMERVDATSIPSTLPDPASEPATPSGPSSASIPPIQPDPAPDDAFFSVPVEYDEERLEEREAAMATLGHNEVAAISYDHKYYVSDVASPYLSERQAREDVSKTKRRHSAIVMTITILLLLGAFGGAGWYLWQAMGASQAPREVHHYETETIERGDLVESIDTTSLVLPVYELDVSPGASGTVAEVYVAEGAFVSEGDWLFRLDNPAIAEAVSDAQTSLNMLSQEAQRCADELNKANDLVAKAQETLNEVSKNEVEAKDETDADKDKDKDKDDEEKTESEDDTNSKTSAEASKARQKAIEQAQRNLSEVESQAADAQARMDEANSAVYGAQETLNNALAQQALLTVTAPISGQVTNMGSQSAVSSSVTVTTHLCTISDSSRFRVQVGVPNEDRDRVSVGQEVRLAFPTNEDLHVISSIDTLEDTGEALLATIIFDNNNIVGNDEEGQDEDEGDGDDKNEDEEAENAPRIEVGAATDVSIILKFVPDTLIVPLNAVHMDDDGGTHLEVLLDATRGIVTNIPVRVTETNQTHAAVEASNIQAGNSVLVVEEDAAE